MIAALNSVEPFCAELHRTRRRPRPMRLGRRKRRPQVEALLTMRLSALAAWLDGREYLEGRFTAGDIVMTTVLRELVEIRRVWNAFRSSTLTAGDAKSGQHSAAPWKHSCRPSGRTRRHKSQDRNLEASGAGGRSRHRYRG
ncbi:MAG: hypothetical protein WDN69_01000 [Aliidongia sp.]